MTSAVIHHFGRGTPWERSFDIWVPHLCSGNSYVGQLSEIPAVRKSGQEVWWYTCCSEGFMIEFPGIEPRMIMGVLTWKYRPDGYLYYANNEWDLNDHMLTDGPVLSRWDSGFCMNHNGDGVFFYPGKNGPVSGVRFENFTDGMEDYEYFILLDKLIVQAKALPLSATQKTTIGLCEKMLSVPEEIARGVMDYTEEPKDLIEYRTKVANGIEKVQRIIDEFQKGNAR